MVPFDLSNPVWSQLEDEQKHHHVHKQEGNEGSQEETDDGPCEPRLHVRLKVEVDRSGHQCGYHRIDVRQIVDLNGWENEEQKRTVSRGLRSNQSIVDSPDKEHRGERAYYGESYRDSPCTLK